MFTFKKNYDILNVETIKRGIIMKNFFKSVCLIMILKSLNLTKTNKNKFDYHVKN